MVIYHMSIHPIEFFFFKKKKRKKKNTDSSSSLSLQLLPNTSPLPSQKLIESVFPWKIVCKPRLGRCAVSTRYGDLQFWPIMSSILSDCYHYIHRIRTVPFMYWRIQCWNLYAEEIRMIKYCLCTWKMYIEEMVIN